MDYLLEEAGVAGVQGSAFGLDGFFRISYATSDEILKDGSNSRRIGEIMNRDLGIPLKAQASNAEHAVADVKHAHILMEIAEDHMHTAQDMEQILDGLRKSWAIDRVWKTVLSDMMAALPAS